MLDELRQFLDYRMTVAEWIGAALLAVAPYLLIGVVYTVLDTGHLAHTDGLQRVLAFVGGIALWPVLLIAKLC